MRSAYQVGREILAALEAMRPFLDQVPAPARRSVDLTSLGDAFLVTGPAAAHPAEPSGLATRLASARHGRYPVPATAGTCSAPGNR